MRPLVLAFGAFGVVLGLACAVVAHYLPVGAVGWFAYVPPADPSGRLLSTGLRLHWLPSLWALPLTGLVLGVLVAVLVHVARWRLQPR